MAKKRRPHKAPKPKEIEPESDEPVEVHPDDVEIETEQPSRAQPDDGSVIEPSRRG